MNLNDIYSKITDKAVTAKAKNVADGVIKSIKEHPEETKKVVIAVGVYCFAKTMIKNGYEIRIGPSKHAKRRRKFH